MSSESSDPAVSSSVPPSSSSPSDDAAFNDSSVDEKVNETRIRVKKWSAVAFWSYDIENDTCAICHNQLMVPCISCEAEPNHASECTVAWGHCSHQYHFHCITRWLKTRSTCPLDDTEWEFVQY
jgi:RING-box protein 1